jgi:hypothetical protein
MDAYRPLHAEKTALRSTSMRAGAETSGRRHAHLDDSFGPQRGQGLGICVGYNEIDALD